MTIEDLDGATVVDAAGEQIGMVERSYVDEGGAVRMVAVKLGKLFAKHRLVPVDDPGRGDGTLAVPYTKDLVEEAPDPDGADELDGDTLARVRAHYTRDRVAVRDLRVGRAPADEAGPTDERPAVRGAYEADGWGEPDRGGDAAEPVARIRDAGDVIEVPIVEEELVKVPVVKEVLRIRKESVTRPQVVTETLRREKLDVRTRGDADIRVDDTPPA